MKRNLTKIAIVAHVYYPDLWEGLVKCIANFNGGFDLFVSLSGKGILLAEAIRAQFPAAKVRCAENRGYDIWPFLETIADIDLDQYAFVVKLHTKRNTSSYFNAVLFFGSAWRRKLLGFCSSRKRVEKALMIFARNPKIGMVAGHPSVIAGVCDERKANEVNAYCERFVRKVFRVPCPRRFVAGTMFIVRAELLKPLVGRFKATDFKPLMHEVDRDESKIVHQENVAHACERLFGYAVEAQGYRITDIHNRIALFERLFPVRLFLVLVVRTLFRITLKPILIRLHCYDEPPAAPRGE